MNQLSKIIENICNFLAKNNENNENKFKIMNNNNDNNDFENICVFSNNNDEKNIYFRIVFQNLFINFENHSILNTNLIEKESTINNEISTQLPILLFDESIFNNDNDKNFQNSPKKIVNLLEKLNIFENIRFDWSQLTTISKLKSTEKQEFCLKSLQLLIDKSSRDAALTKYISTQQSFDDQPCSNLNS